MVPNEFIIGVFNWIRNSATNAEPDTPKNCLYLFNSAMTKT